MKERYIKTLPTLFLGMFFALLTVGVLFFLEPAIVQTLPPHNSYLLVYVLVFVSVFFLSSYFLSHTRRGLLIALFLTVLLWLASVRLFSLLNSLLLLVVLLSFEVIVTKSS